MNYYHAVQRVDGRWDFARENKRTGVHPVGYCIAWKPFTDKDVREWHIPKSKVVEHNLRKSKYHTVGHLTPEDAAQCYRLYTLDHHMVLLPHNPDMVRHQNKCVVCEAWCTGYAEVNHGQVMHLCPVHCTRPEVEKLYKAPTEIWSSF